MGNHAARFGRNYTMKQLISQIVTFYTDIYRDKKQKSTIFTFNASQHPEGIDIIQQKS